MAPSAIAPQHDGGGNVALGGAIGPRKILPSSKIETPPSPPATETDTETDSDTPPIRPETSRIDTNVPAATDSGTESSSVISPVTSPPYWLHRQSNHARSTSLTSVDSMPTGGITLQDNENSSVDERNNACWAKSVEVTDYVIVNGNHHSGQPRMGTGLCLLTEPEANADLQGSFMNIRKRYSEFDDLRWRLIRTFPNFEAAVPELPPKSLISKFRPRFLEKRRAGLQYFLNCIMLNPEFSGSPVLKEFLFS
ncbi:putative Phox-like protein [Seiridium cardinale]|uniref:Endosomal/vacuolar adapter protein YPT35 n=1 Tax=Seiridium cardinale TaxID=138064 RepID=A0ABR2XV27_9PEZI